MKYLKLFAVSLNPLGAENFKKLLGRHHARGLAVDFGKQ
jgi:hypothetical protein